MRIADMRCVACGAEMHLIEMAPDETMVVHGYEERTFRVFGLPRSGTTACIHPSRDWATQ